MSRWAGAVQPALALLAPVLVVQGRRVRATTPRLPEAEDPRGQVPGGEGVLRLAVVGESTAAGCGAARHDEALAGWLARELADRTAHTVEYRAIARNGITARRFATELAHTVADDDWCPDVIVAVFGVNDLLELNPLRRWERDLAATIERVRDRCGQAPLVLAGMPPVHRFPSLPQPLRAAMGLRARALDHRMRAVAARTDCGYVPSPVDRLIGDPATFFAADRFHPSSEGYRLWAAALAPTVASRLG